MKTNYRVCAVFIVLGSFLLGFFPSHVEAAQYYNTMTFNFRNIKPHNIPILAACMIQKKIDAAVFQEMTFKDGSSMDTFRQSLAAAGYKTDNAFTLYGTNRGGYLGIFYRSTFQLTDGMREYVIGGGTGTSDDTRKLITVAVRDPSSGADLRLYNQHPVSGNLEPSCSQNKTALAYVNEHNHPYTIFMGDFNIQLNGIEDRHRTSCNPIFDSQFWISCRPGETSTHTQRECGGKFTDNQRNIDFVLTYKTNNLKIVDSHMDACGFSIGDSNSNDTDHYPLFAQMLYAPQTPPTVPPTVPPTKPPTVPPTATPIRVPTATPTPTQTVSCPLRSKGDADCKNGITFTDFTCWKEEYLGRKPGGCISADFDLSGTVTILDFAIWSRNFIILN